MKAQNIKLKNGLEIAVYRTTNDMYGNPRYIVHYLSLGLNDYVSIKGLSKYRGKRFGGGYVFQSYCVEDTVQYYYDMVQELKKEKDDEKC